MIGAADERDRVACRCPWIQGSHLYRCPAVGAVRFENDRGNRRDKEGAIWRPNAEKGIQYSHLILLVSGAIQLCKVQVQREELKKDEMGIYL